MHFVMLTCIRIKMLQSVSHCCGDFERMIIYRKFCIVVAENVALRINLVFLWNLEDTSLLQNSVRNV